MRDFLAQPIRESDLVLAAELIDEPVRRLSRHPPLPERNLFRAKRRSATHCQAGINSLLTPPGSNGRHSVCNPCRGSCVRRPTTPPMLYGVGRRTHLPFSFASPVPVPKLTGGGRAT